MTHPHHETALMLLRAAGFEDDEAKVALAERGLGWSMFRSDLIAMAAAVDAKMEAREKALREALARLVHDVRDLADSSAGVAGLHLNGDIAPWPTLLGDGEFSPWIGDALDKARAALETKP